MIKNAPISCVYFWLFR